MLWLLFFISEMIGWLDRLKFSMTVLKRKRKSPALFLWSLSYQISTLSTKILCNFQSDHRVSFLVFSLCKVIVNKKFNIFAKLNRDLIAVSNTISGFYKLSSLLLNLCGHSLLQSSFRNKTTSNGKEALQWQIDDNASFVNS